MIEVVVMIVEMPEEEINMMTDLSKDLEIETKRKTEDIKMKEKIERVIEERKIEMMIIAIVVEINQDKKEKEEVAAMKEETETIGIKTIVEAKNHKKIHISNKENRYNEFELAIPQKQLSFRINFRKKLY